MSNPLIALDWGTSRLRAFLIGSSGEIIERRAFDDGIASVPAGGFPEAFVRAAGDWLTAHTEARIVLAGMVGSRNGWVEAPYARCPAGPGDLVASRAQIAVADGRTALLVPGVSCDDGMFDVIRGEETLVFGTGVSEGLICLPGTHSKWVEMKAGRIMRFASFMTGEVYGLLRHQSLLSRLAEESSADDDKLGLAQGLIAARRPAGLLNAVFSARSEVLAGRLPAGAVGPYLSALLVGQEILGAQAMFGSMTRVTLVAEGPVCASYRAALVDHGVAVDIITPEATFVAGVLAFAKAANNSGLHA
jgi:2-dehydro-3-deoxygalactonokinase